MVPSPHSIYASTVASCEAVDLSGTDTTAHKAACEALQTTAIDPVGGNMCLYTYARGSCQCEGCSHSDALGVCVADSLDTTDNPDYCGSGDEVCQVNIGHFLAVLRAILRDSARFSTIVSSF